MNAKCSSKYLTPQANRSKPSTKLKRTMSNENLNDVMSDSLFEKLMSCPIKRQLVLHLINSEKNNIEEYKHNRAKEEKRKKLNASPFSRIKKRYHCESPTALLRRRALEQQNHQNVHEENQSDSSGQSSSQQSCASLGTSNPSPIPFEKLLDGVVAYVEIKSKDQDRSNGAKALMKAMGATIRDTFTKDVTHVVFKDGSFTTYQKAKLMKVHLVSVLWVEAVRSNRMRVRENKFPAIGTECYDNNVSHTCSQLQKEYEEMIRDELHRSLATGTPLPSTQALINRRRTLMTPSSSKFSEDLPSSQDQEVEKILDSKRKTFNSFRAPFSTQLSPEVTSDEDSDLGPVINGTIVNRKHSSIYLNDLPDHVDLNLLKSLATEPAFLENSELDNGHIEKSSIIPAVLDENESVKENHDPNTSDESLYYKRTPKAKILRSKRSETTKTAEDQEIFNIPDDNFYRRKTRQLNTLSNSKIDSDISKSKADVNSSVLTTMPVLELSDKSNSIKILSKNVCSPRSAQVEGINEALLKLPSHSTASSNDVTGSTSMSSLQIMSKEKSLREGVSTSTNMSDLLIKSISSKDSSRIADNKHLKSDDDAVELEKNDVIQEKLLSLKESYSPLDTPLRDKYVTKRKKSSEVKNVPYSTRRKTTGPPDINDSGDKIAWTEELSSPTKLVNNNNNIFKSNSHTPTDKPQEKRKRLGRSSKNGSNEKKLVVKLINSQTDTENSSICESNSTKSPSKGETVLKKRKINLNSKTQNENSKSSNGSQSSCSGRDDRVNKTRKLYDLDDFKQIVVVSDESERECKRNKVIKRKPDQTTVFNTNIVNVSPNTLVTAKAKKFIEKIMEENKININDILNKKSEVSELEASPPKRKLKQKGNHATRDSSADEQHDLALEFVGKQNNGKDEVQSSTNKRETVSRRKSVRLSQHPRKKLNLDSSTSRSDERKVAPRTPFFNRRSTLEFQTNSQISSVKKLKIDKMKHPSIVCTKMHKDEIQIFNQIVKKLGGFVIEDEVSRKTTHLVAGEPKRTINMLKAVAMGCWILKQEWLLRSLEAGKWLPEEDYEETSFSPSVQQCRLQRQAFGPSYTMDVFQDCGPIFVARSTIPRCSDLKELIGLCKGNVCSIQRNATIVIGEYVRQEGVICVKESWVLDCITFNKKMNLKKYIITPTNRSPVV